jgi:hypothetical protein
LGEGSKTRRKRQSPETEEGPRAEARDPSR